MKNFLQNNTIKNLIQMGLTSTQKKSGLTMLAFCLLAVTAMAQIPPTFTQAFNPGTIGPGSTSTLTFIIDNTGGGINLPDMNFSSTLPASVTLAAAPAATTNCSDGIIALSGGNTIDFSSGTLNVGNSCTVSVNVTSSTPGAHTNASVTLYGINNDPAVSNTADLTVATDRPGFTKSFAPSSVFQGGVSTLTFTIDNTANGSPVISFSFVDDFPIGVVVASPNNLSTNCGTPPVLPTLVSDSESSQLSFSYFGNASFPGVAAGASCTVTVDVVTTGIGQLDNVTSDLLATVGISSLNSGKASAALTVDRGDPIHISKSFTDDPVPPGGTAELEFTLKNFDRNNPATDISFTDDLTTALAGLTYSSLLYNDCGGTVSGVGTTMVDFSGGTLPADGGTCTIRIECYVPSIATPGVYVNTTDFVTGTVGGNSVSGNTAATNFFVEYAPTFTKSFTTDPVGPGGTVDLEFTITNTDPSNALTDIEFLDNLTFALGNLFPVSVTLPGNPVCGGTLSMIVPVAGQHALSLTGGSIAAGSNCTFTVQIDIPNGFPAGIYTNTTSEITGTVNGNSVTGTPATDDLEVLYVPALEKSFSSDVVAPGEQVDVTFTLSLDALASGDATAISFTDDLAVFLTGTTAILPANPDPPCGAGSSLTGSAGDTFLTLAGATLSPGGSCSFTVTLDISAGVALGTHTNTTSGVTATIGGEAVTGSPATAGLLVSGLMFTKEFIGDPALPGETVNLVFTFDNTLGGVTTNISFNDDLNATLNGLAATGAPTVNTCGGTMNLLNTMTFLSYSGGSVTGGSACIIEVPVLIPAAAPIGTYGNVTSNLSVNIDGNPVTLPPATDNLAVDDNLLDFTKEFTNDPVLPGGTVDLTFTLTNIDATRTVDNITFSDDFEAMLSGTVATGATVNTCGGMATSGFPTSLFTYAGGTLTPGSSCTITIQLQLPAAVAASNITNTTSEVTGDVGGIPVTGGTATDVLRVRTLSLEKAFDGPGVSDGTVGLTFTLTNLDQGNNVTAINFSDNLGDMLPGATVLTLPTPAQLAACGGSANVSGTGTSTFNFMAGELGTGGSCSFSIVVQLPCNNFSGMYTNTTSVVNASSGGGAIQAPAAEADLDFTGDMNPPNISCPADPMAIEWIAGFNQNSVPSNTPQDASISPGTYGMATGTDHCGAPISSANYQDVLTGPFPGNCATGLWIVTRTWTVTALNGQTNSCDQVFSFIDTTDPTINSCPSDPAPIEWVANFNTNPVGANTPQDSSIDPGTYGTATATDNCGTPTITYQDVLIGPDPMNCPNLWVVERTWTATDNCGLTDECVQTFTFTDNTPPVITDCPADPPAIEWPIGFNLNSVPDNTPQDPSIDPSIYGTPTATDNCGTPTATYQDILTGPFPNACTTGLWIVERTWTVTDACGLTDFCVQTFNFIDTTPPVIVTCPADPAPIEWPVGFNLNPVGPNTPQDPIIDESQYENVVYSDNCGVASVDYQDLLIGPDPMNCPNLWIVERTWTVTDFCGLSVTCVQTFTFTDITPPTITNCPADPAPIEWTAGFNTAMVGPDTPQDPSIAPAIYGTPSANDNCGTPTLTYQDEIVGPTPANCPNLWVVTRTWTATDNCDLTAVCVQTFTFTDTTPPVISTCPPTRNVEGCGTADIMNGGLTSLAFSTVSATITEAEFAAEGGAASDNCGIVSYSYIDVASGTCPIVVTRVFTVTDVCGLTHTCTQVINIDDTIAPTVVCQDIPSINLTPNGNLTITPTQVFDAANSSDNCGGALTLVSVSPNTFSCLNEGSNTVTLTAKDDCGNQNTCTATVFIEDFITNIMVSSTPESCAGSGDGTITASATAGGGQLQFSIDGVNFQLSGLFANLTPGTYTVIFKVFGIPAICEETMTVVVGTNNNPPTWYKDFDNDGYSDGTTQVSCTQPANYKLLGDLTGPEIDCNDNNPLEFPGQVWYPDADNDGYGTTPAVTQCARPAGHKAASELTEADTDCVDTNAAINPGATEVCNGKDDNCDGNVDEGLSGATYVGNVSFTTQAQIDAWPACYAVINGNVTIQGAGINNLGPLSNIEEITGNFFIQSTGLTNMTGLGSLTQVGGSVLIFFNSSLTSLNGLGALATVGGNLSIYYNFSLTDCCAILDLINGAGVTGSKVIFYNAAGCNSVANINATCPTNNPIVAPDDNISEAEANCGDCLPPTRGSVVRVFPNPASDKLNVLFSGTVESGTMELIDVMGRKIITYKITKSDNIQQIDVNGFNKGIYLLNVKIEGNEPVAKRVVIE